MSELITTTANSNTTNTNTGMTLTVDPVSNKMVFPADFCPGIHFVICGRGKKSYGHMGNKHFVKEIVSLHLEDYSYASTKLAKSAIVQAIVNQVEAKGGFIRFDTRLQRYVKAEDNIGREKTSQCLRDGLKNKYKSSKEIKKENRRQKRLAEESEEEQSVELAKPVELKTYLKQLQFSTKSASCESPTTVMDLIHHLRLAEVLRLPLTNGTFPPRTVSIQSQLLHEPSVEDDTARDDDVSEITTQNLPTIFHATMMNAHYANNNNNMAATAATDPLDQLLVDELGEYSSETMTTVDPIQFL
ncbi:Nitrilase family, member 2 [Seminavis robusta]|uniref:Nitrilase family, member 2 n=1 Tax=Seminavis robusta TaxID=568900 RepID=A0A9N8E1G0_9STRA|nr:Nitrilase family, member 2 [Seminavis robusta]|eukprot:Sro555_g165730.1 Nitrilase family, member 2 (301) ;mRNA; r:38234-39136